jgi:hypothetical protein
MISAAALGLTIFAIIMSDDPDSFKITSIVRETDNAALTIENGIHVRTALAFCMGTRCRAERWEILDDNGKHIGWQEETIAASQPLLVLYEFTKQVDDKSKDNKDAN